MREGGSLSLSLLYLTQSILRDAFLIYENLPTVNYLLLMAN